MLTTTQQQTLDQLAEIFSQVNALAYEPTDIFAMIDAEKNAHVSKKMGREASIKASYAVAKEKMDKYFEEFITPVLNRYFPGWRDSSGNADYMAVTRNSDGRLRISWGNEDLEINASHVRKQYDGFEGSEFAGFYTSKNGKYHPENNLSHFNNEVAKWAVDVLKSKIGY